MPALSRKSIKIIIFVFYSKLENDVKYLGLSNLYRSCLDSPTNGRLSRNSIFSILLMIFTAVIKWQERDTTQFYWEISNCVIEI
jgi:hypothetical protein